MNYGDFRKLVAGYLNRDESALVINGVDVLGDAINSAKRSAQRKCDFNVLRDVGWVQANALGVEMSTITADQAGTTPLSVKKINGCWQYSDGANPQKIRQINFILSTDLKNILPTLMDYMREPRTTPVTLKNRCYVYGTKFYVTGFTDPTLFWLDVVKRLPDYEDENEEDFFLTDCRDWMLWKSLASLNGYLKETERIQVSKAMLDAAWEEIVSADAELAGANDDANTLD